MGIFGKYRVVLGRYGVKFIRAILVLMAMCDYSLTYQQAVQEVADFYHDNPERVHSQICYWLLFAGIETAAAPLFEKMVQEVAALEEEEYEDGIYFE